MLKHSINIKNRGFNETILRNNGKKNYSRLNWRSKYNGNDGQFSVDISKNGKNKHIDIHFDNHDLAQLFNIPSVNMPLEQRLKKDFLLNNKTRKNYHTHRHEPMIIEIIKKPTTSYRGNEYDLFNPNSSLHNSHGNTRLTHISSPEMGEELALPLSIRQRQNRKRSPKKVSKKVYKVIRIPKLSKKTKSNR